MPSDNGSMQTGFSLGELLDMPAENWAFYVDKLIPKRGLTILGGESGVGKSHLLISMAFALACDEPALGCLNVEPSRVQFFTEDDRHVLKPYIDRIGANFSDPDRDSIDFQTSVRSMRELWTKVDKFKPDIIMIDPMMRMAGTINSNNNEAVNDFLDEQKEECDRRGCAMVYTRHMRKPQANEAMDEYTAFARVIGAQAWISNPYHRLVMWKKKGEHFLTSYSKFMANFHWRITFDSAIGKLVVDKANGSSVDNYTGSKYTDPIFEVFRLYPGAGYSAADIKYLMDHAKLLDNIKLPALRAELRRLVKEQRLNKIGDKYEVASLVEVVEENYRQPTSPYDFTTEPN